MTRSRPTSPLLRSTLARLFAACLLASAFVSKTPAAAGEHHFRTPKTSAVRLQAFKADPPEVALGERLFMETRFAQFFAAHANGDANATLVDGDLVLAASVTTSDQSMPGPFAGLSMNCRACHLVAEHRANGKGNRSYSDFARRSPIPSRDDGRKLTARNSQPLVNALVSRECDVFLHNDGEFGSGTDLVKGTFTGRNFGWLARERPEALRHIAHIIREDNGRGQLALEFGGYPYRKVFAGSSSEIAEDYLVGQEFRIDVLTASDGEILDAIARAVESYMRSLRYSRDERLEYDSSPYDVFLEKNKLPRRPTPGQSTRYYIRYLLTMLDDVKEPRYVTSADRCFKTLKQDFHFGPLELAGMKLFFSRSDNRATPSGRSVGNCVACHAPPHFSDFAFHNTGASQEEYDSIHGPGAFTKLFVPELGQRATNFEAWLPATSNHPRAVGSLCEIPSADFPGRADLGLWNVFANPDHAAIQPALLRLFPGGHNPEPSLLLPQTIGLFKTPTLRGLAMSPPYLHTGQKDSLEDVVKFYKKSATLARAGALRNGAAELAEIHLQDDDVAPLAAFLRALNEDYE
jgi:cytochrome c peroxidase